MTRLRVALAASALVAALASPGAAQAAEGSCAWEVELAGDQVNFMFPDEASRYWTSLLPVPDGGHIEIAGRYPHTRYFSFGTYGERFHALDAIADVEIEPDAGSSNPFLAGADRTVTARNYRVRVVPGGLRTGTPRPTNTLYSGGAPGRPINFAGIALRVYEPDRGQDKTGGVGLPAVSIVNAVGEKVEVPECPERKLPDVGARQALAASGAAVQLPNTGLLGRDPPRWHKFTNNSSLASSIALDSEATGGAVADPARTTLSSSLPPGGIGENIHNKYIYATASREFGQVLLLRGKLPTTPRTYDGEPVMGAGQLRFWSMCGYGQATNFYACVNDDAIPVDRRGRYTIALSTAAARPSNAVERCGIAWLPAGPVPQTILFVRNMLPAPDFAQAIQQVEPGREAEQMGDYYPRGTYYPSPADVEQLGCRKKRLRGLGGDRPPSRPTIPRSSSGA